MIINKITPGFVIQQFQNGKCLNQEFFAGTEIVFESEMGDILPEEYMSEAETCYFPLNMEQP